VPVALSINHTIVEYALNFIKATCFHGNFGNAMIVKPPFFHDAIIGADQFAGGFQTSDPSPDALLSLQSPDQVIRSLSDCASSDQTLHSLPCMPTQKSSAMTWETGHIARVNPTVAK
jgi:hypothetical protein